MKTVPVTLMMARELRTLISEAGGNSSFRIPTDVYGRLLRVNAHDLALTKQPSFKELWAELWAASEAKPDLESGKFDEDDLTLLLTQLAREGKVPKTAFVIL